MAEYSPQMGALEARAPVARGAMVNLIGAAVSLALIAGLGVWGYRLVVRDVSGVPVVRAIEGPIRVQPENPGGVAAEHQGLAVNNVAAEGIAERPADSLVLAPEPLDLSAEDLAAFAPAKRDADQNADPAGAGASEPADPEEAAILALADQIAAQVAAQSAGQSGGQSALASPPASGLARSLIPLRRPAALSAGRPAGAAAAVRDISQSSLPAGTTLVQLGAFPDEAEAKAAWAAISRRFEELMFDKARVVVEAESVGRTLYRLRAEGFAQMSDARQFCAALMAEGADCIPVTLR
ncbi:SPOR domain-containing protein [Poseidonocella sedimentorum]|uniref:Sporulation related domain-containing protein n=1 Tax=Poseidonocella sedimentorum TaxID=871652 RepID=A0A1I6DFT2_9RHOB|nr:SPOR domain-containing protein [Poseidonocella sedimentorum]SFR04304.1 Sporulation related domain-containing protein [Poseidonocella sedimentorum]